MSFQICITGLEVRFNSYRFMVFFIYELRDIVGKLIEGEVIQVNGLSIRTTLIDMREKQPLSL